ncbi:hypothetical protein OIK40_11090 [Erythrobacter sp. sf7]|uniref:Uncharacterized protein n=1 Tax=Erythrobacter fulvus TaxID=2987523 RepID=A0ABT5JQY6_9SPHN|nr:hypothetical protein [Erythrobacter fulvus]MDC8755183.1 hypothetical protein [Erythrobacter fulvus]
MKRIVAHASALAAIFLAMPQPALAETPAEIEDYFKSIREYSLPYAQDCASGRAEFESECGRAMEDLICSVNAMYIVLEENNVTGGRFVQQLTSLTNFLANNEAYINELMSRGEMRNPGKMGSRMSGYCSSINSTIRP